VKFNVDVKVQNDPDRLFRLMHDIISAQPDWETALAPRILLGLWHPRFIAFAKERLPYCRRSYIGNSIYIARKYFWKDCHAFSLSFGSLTTGDGERYEADMSSSMVLTILSVNRFRKECKNAGKNVLVWTVNVPDHMMEVCGFDFCGPLFTKRLQAVRWDVHAIITDVTNTWLNLRTALEGKIRLT